MKLSKILVGVDFSDTSRAALRLSLGFARRLGSVVEALHVLSPPPFVPMDVMLWGQQEQKFVERLREDLDAFVRSVGGTGADGVLRRVETGVPYDVLVTASEFVDLLVVGTHGRTGVAHLLIGSVAERTLRFARCPVLTVPFESATE